MSKTVFIPLTDELVYERPEQILGRVVPFTQTARVLADGPPSDETAVVLSERAAASAKVARLPKRAQVRSQSVTANSLRPLNGREGPGN